MGCWKGATFKECIREQLTCYSEGMTTQTKHNFKLGNVHGNAYHEVIASCIKEDYTTENSMNSFVHTLFLSVHVLTLSG